MYLTLGNARGIRSRRRGLGAAVNTGGLIASGAGIATTATVSSLAAGTALGAWAGPIGAGVGAVVGIIAGLWSAHNARVKGAKTENQIVGSAVQAFDGSIKALFSAANAGQITGAGAAQACQQLLQQYWAAIAQVKGIPGTGDASGGGASCGTWPGGNTCGMVGVPGAPNGKCGKTCTAGCCVGCLDLTPSILQAIAVFQNPAGGTISVCTVYGSGYGLSQRSSYNLAYTPPPVSAVVSGTLASAGSAVDSALGLSSTSTVAGIPTWLLLVGGAAALMYYAA
jgi:hypothetical protein